MKKIAIMALLCLSSMTFAWEWSVVPKLGLDVYRTNKPKQEQTNKVEGYSLKDGSQQPGLVIGIEGYPLMSKYADLGLGIEYNSLFFNKYKSVQNLKKDNGDNHKITSKIYTFPLYLAGHLNVYSKEYAKFYALGRLGYAFSGRDYYESNSLSKTFDNLKSTDLSGVYYGLGAGANIKHFIIEALYDGIYHNSETGKGFKEFTHKVGIRLGYEFGSYMLDKKKSDIVEVYDKGINAQCYSAKKMCVIHGFEVDGREPDANEALKLKNITDSINKSAYTSVVDIVGHTDSTGSDEYNMALSQRRANEVATLLRKYGLKDSIVIRRVYGVGEREPMSSNNTEFGKYNNRRVELRFIEK